MKLQTSSLSTQIEKIIKNQILTGELLPGQRLSSDDIAARLDVSKMPVRDALMKLENIGFVNVSPRKGVFVAELSQERFKNILDIRIALECLAIELGISSIPIEEIDNAIEIYSEGGKRLKENGDVKLLLKKDNLVHELIIRYCHNPKLIEIMNDLQDLINWAHQTVALHQPDALARALPEHFSILDALKSRDPELAKKELRAHLRGTLERTLAAWKDHVE